MQDNKILFSEKREEEFIRAGTFIRIDAVFIAMLS